MSSERTLVLIKPDALQRGLAGTVIDRIERTGLKLVGMKLIQMDRELAAKHYAEHEGKAFYQGLVEFITSGPLVAMCVSGPGAIRAVRRVMGDTDPLKAAPGTIRGDLAIDIGRNLVHGSAGAEDAAREIALFFRDDELVSYHRAYGKWIVGG